jgi:outer membrane protein assembly factor BamB
MMKRVLAATFALMMMAAVAMADGHGGPGGSGGPGGERGDFGAHANLTVGSDGTVYITRAAATSTAASPLFEVVAIRSTGATAWTATLPTGSRDVELSGTNLLTVTDTTASGAATPTEKITAISAATGVVVWTLSIDGRVSSLEPFSGGTYVVVVKPSTTSGGTSTRTLEAVSSAGAVLWSVTF